VNDEKTPGPGTESNTASVERIVMRMIDLFNEYRDDFGLCNHDFPGGNFLEKACEFEDKFARLVCEHNGHDYIYDQCGYWGHQFCCVCHEHKYGEIGPMSCSDAIAKIGNITEEEYQRNNSA